MLTAELLLLAVEFAQHFVVISGTLFGGRSCQRIPKHVMDLHAASICQAVGLIRWWSSTVVMNRRIMRRIEAVGRLRCQALWRRGSALLRLVAVGMIGLLLRMRLVAHVGSSRRSRSTTVLSSILMTAAAVGARVISAMSRARIRMRRTIIMLGGLSLPLKVIR